MMIKRTEGKIKSDFGMDDYYKYYCKDNDSPVSKAVFNKVISCFNQKIVDLIGMDDYYKYYCKDNDSPVSKAVFNKVISCFNQKIVDLIIHDGLEFTPIMLQTTFCIRKTQRIPKIKDGKLINSSPIDWKTTNQLWLDDPEAKEKKILIKYLNNHTSKHVFRIKIIKSGYHYNNRKLYRFKASRSFQRLLSKRILDVNQENFNAFNLY